MPAEHAYLELGAEHLWPQILDRAGLAIGAIVEKGREPSARSLKHLFRRGTNRLGLGIIEIKALDADLVAKPGNVVRFSRRGKHAPAACLHLPR